MSDRVSVIVPTYNRAALLAECLDSLLAQTVPAFEIIVVDDGSTDDTTALLARLPAPVRAISKSNGGKPSALNLALPQARGDWIWFFDDDDVALERSIEARLAAASRTGGCDLVISRLRWGRNGPDGRIVAGDELRWPTFGPQDFYRQFLRSCFAHMNGMLIRRDRASAAGLFRTDLLTSEDYDFSVRVARGATVAVCDEATFVFRQHDAARGPASQRYSASERLRRFADGDASLGRWIRATHTLPEYLGLGAEQRMSDEVLQAALSARLSVMAGKGLLEETAADAISLARALDGVGRDLDENQCTALKSALQERYLTFRIGEAPAAAVRAFAPLAGFRAGRRMLKVIARAVLGLAWWQRGAPTDRARLVYVALRLHAAGRF